MRRFSVALGALLLLSPVVAVAQGSAPATIPVDPSGAALSLDLHLGDSGLDAEAVRLAIERELRVPVAVRGGGGDGATGKGALEVRVVARRRASVSHDDGHGRRVSRTVELPEEPARAVEVIALLAGNVARNEAEELLAALTPGPPAAAAAGESSPAASSSPDASGGSPGAATPAVSSTPLRANGTSSVKERSKPASGDSPKGPKLDEPPSALNLSLWHPLALVPDSQKKRMHFDLALGYGRSGALHGFALAVGHERVDQETEGFLGAVLWSHAGGSVRGAQLAGVLATGGADLKGASAAGVAAWREGDVVGAEGAGVVTVARDVEGVQLAGAVSVARDVKGLQAAGGLNVARKVRGVQLGVVNVAEEIDGAGIGLVTIAGNGRVQPTAWFASTTGTAVGVKFVAGHFYSNVGLSLETDGNHGSTFVGGGPHIPIGRWHVDLGVDWQPRYDLKDSSKDPRNDLHYRAKVGVEPTPGVTLFAGGGVRHPDIGSSDAGVDPEVLVGISVL